ncbi:hypothetical protein [Flavobacterium sp. GCM10023249]|uniref:hypothetical protein n=1 Tax=unclassified Flavobacterium TaxID=196869 RepID=UPI003623AE98
MKKVFIISLFALGAQFSFSQSSGCGIKDVQVAVEKAAANSKQQEAANQAKYVKALAQLTKVKKWNATQEGDFGLRIIESNEIKACEENKRKAFMEFMEVLKTADEKNVTEANCKVKIQAEEKFNNIIQQNAAEWKVMLDKIGAEYKAVTKKDLVIE